MDALLLAGGFGTRLRPLTYTSPKPLLPVAGRPMLEWMLDRLPPEVERVVVAVNWKADDLEAYFEARPGKLDCRVVREAEPLGTAGAVLNCRAHLHSDRFFVLNGDIVSDMDLGAMVAQHDETGAVGTIALKEVAREDVVNFGVVALDEEDPRRIRDFVEKPKRPEDAPSRLINAGAYLLERQVLDLIEPGRLVSMEKEVFPQLLPKGLYGWEHRGTWIDVGDPDRLRAAHVAMGGKSPEHAPGSVVGADSTIAAGARVVDCVLGDGVTIEATAELDQCVVGDGETVSGHFERQRIWSKPVPVGYPDKQVGNRIG